MIVSLDGGQRKLTCPGAAPATLSPAAILELSQLMFGHGLSCSLSLPEACKSIAHFSGAASVVCGRYNAHTAECVKHCHNHGTLKLRQWNAVNTYSIFTETERNVLHALAIIALCR